MNKTINIDEGTINVDIRQTIIEDNSQKMYQKQQG